jgi:hypothetical protein
VSNKLLQAKPRCFTDEQWADWLSGFRGFRPNLIDFACQDCSPEFKIKAMAAGKCDWPCVEFFMMDDGTMEGRRTSVPGSRGYPEGRRIITLFRVKRNAV